ncbi:hypothetical protein [Thalassospira lucentensis]|uniref:hypothetical protein n=1 Tax=Thalassospira lucentensis TaxID=168935 RepID=UPI003D2D5D75|tara:strand:+ start:233504 stop:234256 length:753 start_codon:yes stop_codon:yes gene_type:complete
MSQLQTDIRNRRLISGQFGAITFGKWGIEFSDRHSFATLTDTPRNAHLSNDIWQFRQGRWQTRLRTAQTDPTTITAHAQFTAIDDAPLQDAVLRMVFDKHDIAHGAIAGKTFEHRDSDKYRLYPISDTPDVRLVGTDGCEIIITFDTFDGAGRFAPYLYLRDRGDHWIIHARLLPINPVDHVWLRWANRFFTLSAPDPLARALWDMPGGQKLLWRLRERLGRHCPEIQGVPLNIVLAGQTLSLGVTCRFL